MTRYDRRSVLALLSGMVASGPRPALAQRATAPARNRIALTLNLGAARHAGITVPPPVLVRADRVIE